MVCAHDGSKSCHRSTPSQIHRQTQEGRSRTSEVSRRSRHVAILYGGSAGHQTGTGALCVAARFASFGGWIDHLGRQGHHLVEVSGDGEVTDAGEDPNLEVHGSADCRR
jgi:hypothetical protein